MCLQKADAGWVPFEVTFDRAGHFDFPSPTDYTDTVFIYRPPYSDLGPTLLLHPLSWQVSVSPPPSTHTHTDTHCDSITHLHTLILH